MAETPSHSGRFDREYFCHECHLQYCGYWGAREGREPCPYCGNAEPCAVDTFAHVYCWISNPNRQKWYTDRGMNAWEETAWWKPEWMNPEWVASYEKYNIPNHPRPESLKLWHRRERQSMKRLMRRMQKDETETS